MTREQVDWKLISTATRVRCVMTTLTTMTPKSRATCSDTGIQFSVYFLSVLSTNSTLFRLTLRYLILTANLHNELETGNGGSEMHERNSLESVGPKKMQDYNFGYVSEWKMHDRNMETVSVS